MKLIYNFLLLIFVLSISQFEMISKGKVISYKDLIQYDSLIDINKSVKEYFDMFKDSSYKYIKLDSTHHVINTKDSFGLGNKVEIFNKNIKKIEFSNLVNFKDNLCFQSGLEKNNKYVFLTYTTTDILKSSCLIIYDYQNNMVVDSLFNAKNIKMQDDNNKIVFNSLFKSTQYLYLYDILKKELHILDSTSVVGENVWYSELDSTRVILGKSDFFRWNYKICSKDFKIRNKIEFKNNFRYMYQGLDNNKMLFIENSKGSNDKYITYDIDKKTFDYKFEEIKLNHISYNENENYCALLYDSLLYKRIKLKSKNNSLSFNYDIGYLHCQYIRMDSTAIYAYCSTFSKNITCKISLADFKMTMDTTYKNKVYEDTLIVIKNKDHYIAYYYAYKKGANKKSDLIYTYVYGGFTNIQTPFGFSESSINNGMGYAFTIISGDGNFGWNSFLNGNQSNYLNCLSDVDAITNDIYERGFCTFKSIILNGGSYGATLAASVLTSKNAYKYDSGVLEAGEYDIEEEINTKPYKYEQYGDIKDPTIKKMHESISPLNNIVKAKELPILCISGNEYDINVIPNSSFKLKNKLDSKNFDYYFNVIKGADHWSNRGYYQMFDQFIPKLFLAERLALKKSRK